MPKTRRRMVAICLLVLAFPLVEVLRVTAGPNFHEIEAGKLYRSAQLSYAELDSATGRFGIRTIVNLRNACPDEGWYREEKRLAADRGITHHDLNFSAYYTPAPQELQKLMAILDTAPRPLLVHCRRGADRTGLVSALAYLHDHDDGVEEARALLSLRYGHFGLGKVAAMRNTLESYFTWLEGQNLGHSRAALRRWIAEAYRPGTCWAVVEPIDHPERLPLGQPGALRFRLHNRSNTPWQFRQSSNVGMHLRGYLEPEGSKPPPGTPWYTPPRDRRLLAAGFFNTTIAPGQSIDLEVPTPAIKQAGRYRVFVDICDEDRECYGNMVGSPPFDRILETERSPVARQ